MIDRLSELRAAAAMTSGTSAAGGQRRSRRISWLWKSSDAELERHVDPNSLEAFLSRVEEVKTGPIVTVEAGLGVASELQEQALQAATAEAEREALKALETRSTEISTAGAAARAGLQALEQSLQSGNPQSADASIRANAVRALNERLRTAVSNHFTAQQSFREAMEAKVARQVRLAFPGASDHDIAEVIAGRTSASAVIAECQEQDIGSLRAALEATQDRCDDIQRLYENARDLRQMFNDLYIMVDHSGRVLDSIERQVASAKYETEGAVAELTNARRHRCESRRRCCIVGVLLLVILAILALIFINHLSPKAPAHKGHDDKTTPKSLWPWPSGWPGFHQKATAWLERWDSVK